MPQTQESGTEQVQDQAAETIETPAASDASNPVDRSALESQVSAGLAALSGEDDPRSEDVDETAETSNETAETDKTSETSETSETSTSEENDEAAAQDENAASAKAVAASESDAPTLPAAYRRSLKAAEWTDEEIDQAAKTQGAGFLSFAKKVHESRNAEVNRWAELGRAAKTQQTAVTPTDPFAALKAVDIEA